jgi:hypothetical protein
MEFTTSDEKIESHRRINAILYRWLEFHKASGRVVRVVTMPANSGKQENQILEHIEDKGFDNVVLHTYDNQFRGEETGIKRNSVRWKHVLCKDIFTALYNENFSETPIAAWFDLMGGLSDQNKQGLQKCVAKLFDHGSLIWITLQVHGARGVFKCNTKQVYDAWASTPEGRVAITDSLLVEAVKETGKYIRPTMPPYVYRRATTTYAVYGYIVGKY